LKFFEPVVRLDVGFFRLNIGYGLFIFLPFLGIHDVSQTVVIQCLHFFRFFVPVEAQWVFTLPKEALPRQGMAVERKLRK
jgi:hypothetical protein